MNDWPSATIIVLNWNGRAYLPACLEALLALDYPDYQITLVDNASTDDSLALVEAQFPQVRVLRNRLNMGYAAGNNVALRQLNSDVAVLVNPDIVVARDWLRELLAPMAADEKAGVTGCKLHYPGGRLLQHAGGLITHPRAMPGHRGVGEVDRGQYDELCEVEYVIGAAITFRRRLLETIGLLDEGFFMYFEDADFCTRARRAGFRVVYAPRATAIHDESAFSVKGSPAYLQHFHAGRWRYLLKHFETRELLEETLPAEMAWLGTRQRAERYAVGQAYRTCLGQFGSLLWDRVAAGAPEVDEVQREALTAGLQRLREAAAQPLAQEPAYATLAAHAVVRERPFHSAIPVIGPLIAGLRSQWAAVAVRPYVRALARQQNAVNEMLVERLRKADERLQTGTVAWLAQDREQLRAVLTQAALRHELAQSYQLLTQLEARLGLAEQATDNEGGTAPG